ncbi:hypothetical protein RJT34_26143 [Clitoria ternatea]|uniref:Uncharacterized protein n=1 Tax=Clitoria ternatea TaxID=43366 RepID=A0AAN9F6A8_CLITE
MGWSAWYLDGILIPLGLLINFAYHVWLWHKVQTQPSITILGIDADGRCLWVAAMIKVSLPNLHTTRCVMTLVTTEYLSELLRKATVLSIVGNRLLHTGLPLLLWIFGPMMAFSCSVAMLLVLHKVNFVATKEKFNIGGINC